MKIPIDRKTSDQFYRYQMEEIAIKIEGRGNGIKTILLNLADVGVSLKRDPVLLLKYLGYELGTQGKREHGPERYIVNGQHPVESIQTLIYQFIDNYVMCKKCNNPETFYIKTKGLFRECYACGFKSKTEGRLSNFIAKDLDASVRNESYSCSVSTFLSGDEFNTVVSEEYVTTDGLSICASTSSFVSSFELVDTPAGDGVFDCTTDFLAELDKMKSGSLKCVFLLAELENYLVRTEREQEICKYLDVFIKDGFCKKSDIFMYFRVKSKAVDKLSSKKIKILPKVLF